MRAKERTPPASLNIIEAISQHEAVFKPLLYSHPNGMNVIKLQVGLIEVGGGLDE